MNITTLDEFTHLGSQHRVVPVCARVLGDSETPLSVYRKIAEGQPGGFLLESAAHDAWQRYSFVGRNPQATLTADRAGELQWLGTIPAGVPHSGDPLKALADTLSELSAAPHPHLPPMVSSLVGYLGWDTIRRIEKLGPGPAAEARIPELYLSIPGDIVIVDHYTSELTLVANVINLNGTPEGIEAAYAGGVERVNALLNDLLTPAPAHISVHSEQTPIIKNRTGHADYLANVEEAKTRIVDGDIFQVVLGQRFDSSLTATPLDVYRMLRHSNPSPYMYLMDVQVSDGPGFAIIGSSPEALVTVKNGTVTTHPIAGSRPRGATSEEDIALGQELLADEKERAEHLMLVDLARNDLAKVCYPGTVDVVEFMELERFSHIMHIVSTVTGQVRPEANGVDVIRATFPAGTLSGAPKPSALKIIDELEPVARGLYGGIVGYLSFSGDLDMAIAIRTGIMQGTDLRVYAGGGIVADSVAQREYEESQNKAAAVLNAAAKAQTLRNAQVTK